MIIPERSVEFRSNIQFEPLWTDYKCLNVTLAAIFGFKLRQ
jgi:hypothetical protein